MVNIFLNLIKVNLASVVKKLVLELIFFVLLDRFASLLLIFPLPTPSLTSVLSLFLLGLNYLRRSKIDRVIVFNIKVSKAAILLKLLINSL